jgi:hypothetical protein
VAVLLAPLAAFIAVVPGDQVDFIPAPTVHALLHTFDSLAGHGGPALLLVLGVFGVLSIVVLARQWRGPDPRSATWPILFALSWLVVPIVVAFALSLVKPIVQDKYLLVTLPGLMLLGAVGFDWIITQRPVVAAIAAVALVGLGGRSVLQVYGHGRDENWRGATALVMAESRPGDGLMFSVSDERTALEYYAWRLGYPAHAPMPLYPADPYRHLVPQSVQTPTYTDAALHQLVAGRTRVWVLQRAANGDVGSPRFQLPSNRYTLLERHRFTDVDVTLYQSVSP